MATAKKDTEKKTAKKTTAKAEAVKKGNIKGPNKEMKPTDANVDVEQPMSDPVGDRPDPHGGTTTPKPKPSDKEVTDKEPKPTDANVDVEQPMSDPVGDRPDPHGGLTTTSGTTDDVPEQPIGDPIGDRPDPHGGITIKSAQQKEIEKKAEEETDKLFHSNGIMLGKSEKKDEGEVKTVEDIIKTKEAPTETPKKTSITKKISKIIQYMWNGQVMD